MKRSTFKRPEYRPAERPPRERAPTIPVRHPVPGARMMPASPSLPVQALLAARLAEEIQSSPTPARFAREHMGRVAALGCIACRTLGLGVTPAQVHHIREGRQARSDFLTIPLCPGHHQGSRMSVHHDKAALMRALGVFSEFDLLARVLELLEPETA